MLEWCIVWNLCLKQNLDHSYYTFPWLIVPIYHNILSMLWDGGKMSDFKTSPEVHMSHLLQTWLKWMILSWFHMHSIEECDQQPVSHALHLFRWSADPLALNGCEELSSHHKQFQSLAYHWSLLTQDRVVMVQYMFMFMFSKCWLLHFSLPDFFHSGLKHPPCFYDVHCPMQYITEKLIV